jgi:hypothetical protein
MNLQRRTDVSFIDAPVSFAAPVPGYDYSNVQGVGVAELRGKLMILVRHINGTMLQIDLDDDRADLFCHVLADRVVENTVDTATAASVRR